MGCNVRRVPPLGRRLSLSASPVRLDGLKASLSLEASADVREVKGLGAVSGRSGGRGLAVLAPSALSPRAWRLSRAPAPEGAVGGRFVLTVNLSFGTGLPRNSASCSALVRPLGKGAVGGIGLIFDFCCGGMATSSSCSCLLRLGVRVIGGGFIAA